MDSKMKDDMEIITEFINKIKALRGFDTSSHDATTSSSSEDDLDPNDNPFSRRTISVNPEQLPQSSNSTKSTGYKRNRQYTNKISHTAGKKTEKDTLVGSGQTKLPSAPKVKSAMLSKKKHLARRMKRSAPALEPKETAGMEETKSNGLSMKNQVGNPPETALSVSKKVRDIVTNNKTKEHIRNNSKTFISHMKIHAGIKSFACKECGKTFSDRGCLRHHVNTHSGQKPFECKFCPKTFLRMGHLRSHLRTHTGEKPYTCNHCGKSFSGASSLRYHINIHTGERPYVCETCGKGFASAGNLNLHKRVHTKEKPFVCNVCRKAFRDPNNLNKHKKIHVRHEQERDRTLELAQQKEMEGPTVKHEEEEEEDNKEHNPIPATVELCALD